MKTFLYVALGGGIGSSLRFMINTLLKPETADSFPVHTFLVNIMGCLLIGLAFAFIKKHFPAQELLLAFITTGVLGGFTTFSSYMLECVQLLEVRKIYLAITYLLLSNLIGLVAAGLGYYSFKVIN